jgi:glutaredoxin
MPNSAPTRTWLGLIFLLTVLVQNNVLAQSINTSGMPFELRRAVENFPVTLYTGLNCTPCDAGKALLSSRGVPFIEKTIDTQADINALKARNLGDQLPVLNVGNRTIKGFETEQWEAALNFASYPITAQLPPAYKNPSATPLVAAPASQTSADPNPAQATSANPTPAPTAPTTTPANNANNPAGIRF